MTVSVGNFPEQLRKNATPLQTRLRGALARLEAGSVAGEKPEPYDFYKAVAKTDEPGWNYQCVGLGISDLREIVETLEKCGDAVDADEVDRAVCSERRRCIRLVYLLSDRWLKMAAKVRKDGSFQVREFWPYPFKKVTAVRPNFEKYAAQLEDAAKALKTFTALIRDGTQPSNGN